MKTFAFSLIVFLALTLFFSVSIKPVSAYSGTTQVYFGAFVGPEHHSTLPEFIAFETEVGKGLSIMHWFQYWNRENANFNPEWMDESRNHGSIPMITWDPGAGGPPPEYPNLTNIVQGDMDSYITQWAQAAKAWGHPFFIRLMHEFNGGWTPWCEGVNGNTQGQFVQAWRHIHDIFTAVGVTTVSWVWSPSVANGQDLASLYPGDSYVDWTGMDGYNWGTNPGNEWVTFDQIFRMTYDHILTIAPNKPMMIAETACVESGGDKGAWFTDVFGTQLPINYKQVRAFVYWQGPIGDNRQPENTFMVESDPEALAAFRQGIASSYYGSNVYSSLNVSPIIAPSGSSNPTPTPQPTNTPWNPYPTPTPSLNPTPRLLMFLCLVLVSVLLILLLWVWLVLLCLWRCLRSCCYIRKLFARSRVSVNVNYLFLEDSNAKKNFSYSFSRLSAGFFSSFFLYSSC